MNKKTSYSGLGTAAGVIVVLIVLAIACVVEAAPVVAYLKYIFS